MTRLEFAMSYANKSGMDLTELLTMGFIFLPCDCGEEGCEGWQAQDKENYMELGIHRLGVGEALSWSFTFTPEGIPRYMSKGDPIEVFEAVRKVILQEKEQLKRDLEKEALYKSIKQVGEYFRNLSTEEFDRQLEAGKEGDFCTILESSNAALYDEGKEKC